MAHYKYQFLRYQDYQFWHPRRRLKSGKASVLRGGKWVSRLLLVDEVGGQPDWDKEVSREPGETITPVLLQQCQVHEIVWFSDGQPVSQREFHVLRSKFKDLQFTVHADRRAIHVRQDGQAAALIWPCGVPDRDAAPAMRLEVALRNPPPTDVKKLRALVVDQLAQVVDAGARELWQNTHRLLDWLQDRRECSYIRVLYGNTEWPKCSAVGLLGGVIYSFKGTSVPLTDLFYSFNRGQTVADFLAANPSVTREQVDEVLEYLIITICD